MTTSPRAISEEELATATSQSIESLLAQSGGDPWLAWRASAFERVKLDYNDKILARAEHYLLRYALASAGLDALIAEIKRFDGTWYHTLIRPIKCLLGISTRDRSLRRWEDRGYAQGRERCDDKGSAEDTVASGDEQAARRFMKQTTEAVIEAIEADTELRSRNRLVYRWMKLIHWKQR